MKPKLIFYFLLIMTSCSLEVHGLKCYVCDMAMVNCTFGSTRHFSEREILTPPKEYLVDCGQSAIACGSFEVEVEDPWAFEFPKYEIWFQRTCFYPKDHECMDYYSLPKKNKLYWSKGHFPVVVSCFNSYRKEHSLPEMKEVPLDSLLRVESKDGSNEIDIETCEEDGCNYWKGDSRKRIRTDLAKGFPKDKHEQRKKGYDTKCYVCNTYTTLAGDPNPCRNPNKELNKHKQSSADAYGCTMLAIYQIAGGLPQPQQQHYFERGLWFPGDQWCLERKYNSTPTGTARTLGKVEKADIQYYQRSWDAESTCTQDDYSRALKGRELSYNYEWFEGRKFYSAEEFADFLNCREHVTNSLNISNPREEMWFNEDAAAKAWAGKSGVFAWVGFRFCGPKDFCNDWTEKELYDKMKDPPVTTTTRRPTGPVVPTEGLVKVWEDNCYKNKSKENSAAQNTPSVSCGIFILCFQTGSILRLLL